MSVNKVILVGRLGHSPEVRYTTNGDAVASFSLATDERWKDARGEKRQRTEWHSVTMFGKLAEVAGQYLKKGSLVYVSGKIRSERYTDRQGVERTSYKIHADELKMLGDGKADSAPQPQQYAPQQQYAPPPHDDVPF